VLVREGEELVLEEEELLVLCPEDLDELLLLLDVALDPDDEDEFRELLLVLLTLLLFMLELLTALLVEGREADLDELV
jgi:hypothetical protein